MELINLKDANGHYVVIKKTDFGNALGNHAVTIFGMDVTAISSLAKVIHRVGYNPQEKFDIDAFCAQVISKVPFKTEQKVNGS